MIFDTTGYTRRQKANARKHRLVGRLKQFLTKPWGIIWIDFNKLILDDDNASDYRSIFEELELLGFTKCVVSTSTTVIPSCIFIAMDYM